MKETLIGILAAISIFLLIWGYKYIEGKNILSSSQYFYVEYDNIDEIGLSTPVLINGYQVGFVSNIEIQDGDISTIKVTLDIKNEIKIPKSTLAEITVVSFMGDKRVILTYAKPCTGADCAQSGDYLHAGKKGLVAKLLGTPDQVHKYMDAAKGGLSGIVTSLKEEVANDKDMDKFSKDLALIFANLKATTTSLNHILRTSVASSLSNIDELTTVLNQNNAAIAQLIQNMAEVSEDIKKSKISETVATANDALGSSKVMMDGMNSTLAEVNKSVASLNSILGKIDNGEGNLGKVVNDELMYDKFNNSMNSLNLLLEDLRLHPERYRRILSKRKMPYEAPSN